MKKILLYLLVVSVVLCFAACSKDKGESTRVEKDTETSESAKNKAEQTEESVTTESKSEQTESSEKENSEKNEAKENAASKSTYEKKYENLISDYKKLIGFRFSDSFDDAWFEKMGTLGLSEDFQGIVGVYVTEDHSDAVSTMIDQLENTFSPQTETDFGYILYDLNKDKTPELFWVRRDHGIVAVFTVRKGEAILLEAFGTRYKGYVSDKGKLYGWGSGGAQDQRCSVYNLTAEGELEITMGFSSGIDYFGDPSKVLYKELVGAQNKEITAERYDALAKEYPQEQSDLWMNLLIAELS